MSSSTSATEHLVHVLPHCVRIPRDKTRPKVFGQTSGFRVSADLANPLHTHLHTSAVAEVEVDSRGIRPFMPSEPGLHAQLALFGLRVVEHVRVRVEQMAGERRFTTTQTIEHAEPRIELVPYEVSRQRALDDDAFQCASLRFAALQTTSSRSSKAYRRPTHAE